jgi:hypothetical protein
MSAIWRVLAFLLVSILVWAAPATAQQVAQGYRLLTDPQVMGGHLVAVRPGTGSAFELLKQAFREVAGFFQGKPMALGGFVDASDRRAEVVFRAALGGSPVGGVAYAIVGGGTGTAGFVFDSPQTIRQSMPRLVQLAGGGTGPATALSWRDVPFPDGSGWMRLPEGWVITFAQKGMAAAKGPHGLIERGVWTQAYTRAAMAQHMAAFPGMPPPTVVVDPTDLVTVFQAYFAHVRSFSQQRGLPPRNLLRVIEVAPAPLVPGYAQAAYLDHEYEEGGVRFRAIKYFMVGNINMDGSYLLYMTYVASRSESFPQNLPVLLEIWASARTAQHVLQERMENAMKNLREAGEIYNQTMQNRARAQQRMHDKWTEVFRGTRVVEDTLTGDRRTVDLAYSREIVQRLNEIEGPGRYREIPLWQLNQ